MQDGKPYRQFHDGMDLRTWNVDSDSSKSDPLRRGPVRVIEPGVILEFTMPDPAFPCRFLDNGKLAPEGRGWTPFIKIQGLEGRTWVMRHVRMDENLHVGMAVNAGRIIGYTDHPYGYANGPHLHLECWIGGHVTNPYPVLTSLGLSGWLA